MPVPHEMTGSKCVNPAARKRWNWEHALYRTSNRMSFTKVTAAGINGLIWCSAAVITPAEGCIGSLGT